MTACTLVIPSTALRSLLACCEASYCQKGDRGRERQSEEKRAPTCSEGSTWEKSTVPSSCTPA